MAKSKHKYWISEDGLREVSAWAAAGLVNDQIAQKMGIAASTLYDWINKYPEISEALKRQKVLPNENVINSLYQNATGYEYEEEQAFKVKIIEYSPITKQKIREEEKIEVVKVKRYHPAETTAALIWLKNRDSENWASDPQMLAVRREELELKKAQAAKDDW